MSGTQKEITIDGRGYRSRVTPPPDHIDDLSPMCERGWRKKMLELSSVRIK
jgi:hypothetical protein